jgi:hypothetical protein
MFTIDKSWTAMPIPIENGRLEAFYRELTREEELVDEWQKKYSASVVSQGGILVTRLRDPVFYQSGVTPRGAPTYKADSVPSELWYLPSCTFEESIESFGFFGFPRARGQLPYEKGISNAVEGMKRVKEFLEHITIGRELTMGGISSTTVHYKLMKGRAFTKEEMLDVLKFNDVEFAASREKWEHREYIKTFLAHQFFVLGAF